MPPLRTRLASIAAATLLSACSALQIDVDVYKGPLVNHEDIQRDQMIAMAMSAKAMMLSLRNRLLDDYVKADWVSANDERRRRSIKPGEWDQIIPALTDPSVNSQAGIRQARQLNAMLSSFDDRADPGLRALVDDLKRHRRQVDEARSRFMAQLPDLQAEAAADKLRTPAEYLRQSRPYAAVHIAQLDLWLDLLQLLRVGGNDQNKFPADMQRSLVAYAADGVARLTQPLLLACAAQMNSDDSIQQLVNRANLRYHNALAVGGERWDADRYRRARDALELALADKPAQGVEALQLAHAMLRQRTPNCSPPADDPAANTVAEGLQDRRENTGVVRAPLRSDRSEDDLDNGKLDDIIAKLANLGATGFDVGRIDDGIDTLADRYAARRNRAVGARPDLRPDDKNLGDEAKRDLKRLDHVLIDLASRMQFLATHLWLIDDQSQPFKGRDDYKAMLESIANNILVHADDLRHRDQHDETLRTSAGAERRAANAAFSLDAERWFDRITNALRTRKAEVLAAETAAGSGGGGGGGEPKAQPKGNAKASTVPSTRFDAALAAVQAQKAGVLSKAAASKANPDANLVGGLLRLALEADQPADSARQARDDAITLLAELNLRPQLMALSDGADRSVDVLDEVIAQLRYLHLDAVRRKGTESGEAKNLEQTLRLARKQREDLAYLRPTNTYLRSVYAATFTQNDPNLRWRNLLLDQFRRMRECWVLSPERQQACAVREGLDKVYWQNINTVRLGAAGSSNFVVAKDDVGNWYVKAMGADPSAMVRAAKQMALYNIGTRFDSNLLRVDDLRERLDTGTENDAEKRKELRDELTGLTSTKSGPAVAERSRTLTLFTEHYSELTTQHLKDLTARLADNKLAVEVKARWDVSLGEDAGRLADAFDDRKVSEALTAARTAADAKAADKPASTAIIDTLSALHRLRATLKAWVLSKTELLESEATDAGKASKAAEDAQAAVDGDETKLNAAADELQKRQTTLNEAKASNNPEEARIASDQLAIAQGEHTKLANTAATARKLRDSKKKDATAAATLLAQAKARQAQAAADVDTVLKGSIDEWVAKRLRVVEETEVAAKIVGRNTP